MSLHFNFLRLEITAGAGHIIFCSFGENNLSLRSKNSSRMRPTLRWIGLKKRLGALALCRLSQVTFEISHSGEPKHTVHQTLDVYVCPKTHAIEKQRKRCILCCECVNGALLYLKMMMTSFIEMLRSECSHIHPLKRIQTTLNAVQILLRFNFGAEICFFFYFQCVSIWRKIFDKLF